jgi:outer membrane protein assembly factor BamB
VYNGTVYIATENNSLYALNASSGEIEWRANLGNPVPASALPCGDINPSGITGTPVIDPSRMEIFLVANLYENQSQQHEFFALSLKNGSVVFQRDANPPGVSPSIEQQRGALGIGSGMVYIPYGGLEGDCGEYHGFVLGVPENNTGSTLSYETPTGREGGIWAASGLAIDSKGDVWVATGNSASSTNFDFGDAVIKLSPSLRELDYFAPTNWASLNTGDTDIGSTAPTLIGNDTVFQIGKQGVGYILNASNLGGIGNGEFSSQVCSGGAYSGTAFQGDKIYIPCVEGVAAITLNLSVPSFAISWRGPSFHPGAPIIAGNAVWVVDTDDGVLYALDLRNGTKLFSYELGPVDHFISPSSAYGRIFVAASDVVYAFNI